jgi:putative transposase
MSILPLLLCLQPILSNTSLHQVAIICEAIFTMTGRVTMLAISRWTTEGGSYRTLQRFFASNLPWLNILWLFFRHHLYKSDETYLLAGDETVITKAGKHTHGVERFFSGLLQKPVSGLAFFALSLIAVKERRSYPLSVEQVIKTSQEKEAAKAKQPKRKKQTKKIAKRESTPVGRKKGSKNKDKTKIDFSLELNRIDRLIAALLNLIGGFLPLTYLVLDGHFGHNQAVLMARKNNLHLISKLRRDSALYEEFDGVYAGRGPRPKYGKKLDMKNLSPKHLVKTTREGQVVGQWYKLVALHKEFAQALNVVILVKTNLRTQKQAHVIVFSSDLDLDYELLVEYYGLRFQIEFNFRDAKQHFGLEDFMNRTEQGVRNAANLSFFMINVTEKQLQDWTRGRADSGILDLKSYYRGLKYAKETIKMFLKKPEPILLEEIFEHVGSLGRIHLCKSTEVMT